MDASGRQRNLCGPSIVEHVPDALRDMTSNSCLLELQQLNACSVIARGSGTAVSNKSSGHIHLDKLSRRRESPLLPHLRTLPHLRYSPLRSSYHLM